MRRAIILAVLLALPVGACATAPILKPDPSVAVLKGDTALDVTYNAIAKVYLSQAPTMDPATKAKVKPVVQALGNVTATADAAEVLGDAATVQAQVASAAALIAQAKSLLHITN